jgi:glutathione S-transferase
VVAPRFLGREGDLSAAEAAERDELPPLLDYLEGAIPDSGYLVGDRLTLADIAVAGPFANFSHCDVAIDSARYPKITAYVNAILSRPSFTQYVERETAYLARETA